MSNKTDQYKTLANTLKILEIPILLHASSNQDEMVESFLQVALRKVKLENEVVLAANYNQENIKNKKVIISISAHNEALNIKYVEQLFDVLMTIKFSHLKFLKFIEYYSHEDDQVSKLSLTINETKMDANNIKFHIGKSTPDKYGRTLKVVVYVNEIIEKLLKPSGDENTWIPDTNMFYLLDLILGEYYMTKHINTISFIPQFIMPANIDYLSIDEAREHCQILSNEKYKHCQTCNMPEYRVCIKNKLCNYCE